MPPKKKKLPVNPIVVGTVSTRSTRRQSIVNIEIPKSSRSKKGGRGISKTSPLNRELTDTSSDAKEEHSSIEFILESSSESERTDRSERIDSSDTDALSKSGSELGFKEVAGTLIEKHIISIQIPKLSGTKKGKGIANVVPPTKKAFAESSPQLKNNAKSESSSLEFILESSSESERADRSEILDSSDTDAFTKSGSELIFEKVTESSSHEIEIPKLKGRGIAKKIPSTRKVATKIKSHTRSHIKDNAEAEHSSSELISDSSSEYERTDRSERTDSSDTDALSKPVSELRPEYVTEPSKSESFTRKIKYSFSKAIASRSIQIESTKDADESNQALLQILQDWDDEDESQEHTTEDSRFGSRHSAESKNYENLEFGAEDMNEIIGKDGTSNTNVVDKRGSESMKMISPKVADEKRFQSMEIIEDNSIEKEVLQNSISLVNMPFEESENIQHESSVDVEESMEVSFEDDTVVGCVIEEIVPDTAEEMIITDSNIDSDPSSEPQIVSDESRDTANNTPILVSDKDSHSIQNEEDMTASEVIDTRADVASEESRSMSTVDSNDAEVRRFFSKENRNDEVRPINEGSSSSNFENLSMIEEQLIDNEIAISQDCMKIQEEIVEENDLEKENNAVEVEIHADMSEGRNKIIDEKEQDILNILEDDSREDQNVITRIQSDSAEVTVEAGMPEIQMTVTEPNVISGNDDDVVEDHMHLDTSENENKIVHDLEFQREQDILSILEDNSTEDQNVNIIKQAQKQVTMESHIPMTVKEPNAISTKDNDVADQRHSDSSENKINFIHDLESKKQDILSILEDNSTEDQSATIKIQDGNTGDTMEKQVPVAQMTVEEPYDNVKINIFETKNLKHDLELQKKQDIIAILEDDLKEDDNITLSIQGASAVALEEQLPVDQITEGKEGDKYMLSIINPKQLVNDHGSMENQMEKMNLEEAATVQTLGKNNDIATGIDSGGVGSSSLEEHTVQMVEEKEVAISVENKIAKMHLGDMSIYQSIVNDVAQFSLQDGLKDCESLKADTSSDCSFQESLLPHSSSEEYNEKIKAKEVKRFSEKSKSPRISIPKLQIESTEKQTKSPKFEKVPKQVTPAKVKEIRPREKKISKEPKIKKNPSPAPKKTNNKNDKKEKPKTEKKEKKFGKSDSTKSDNDTDDTEVRRSSRIKSINDSNSTKKITGRGLVKSKSETSLNLMDCDVSDNSSIITESGRSTPVASPKITIAERKSRWTKSADNIPDSQNLSILGSTESEMAKMEIYDKPKMPAKDPVVEGRLKQFVHLKENSYKTDRMTCKEAKKMTCDCFLTSEEIEGNEYGCGEDCLNRLLLIECGNLCQVGDRCTNKRFQKTQFAPVEVFNTDKKGLGLRAAANIPYGEFILEYVGEVLNSDEFDKRAEVYSQDKNIHYYFMALRADAIIDATMKGNISRFINHSCDPNAETQKWTVNGELRIGFFSTRTILAGEEVTFDYRFQRYGKEAQKCFCGASICRGWLGEEPDSDEEDEDEDEEETVGTVQDASLAIPAAIKEGVLSSDIKVETEDTEFEKSADLRKISVKDEVKISEEAIAGVTPAIVPVVKRKITKKKPRVELFEEIDQLDEEIEMLVSTGLKNQAQTLKLSRLVVRAKDPQQRAKLLRVLRRGELPCRRLFLDYHGLRLIHGYMIDAQQLVVTNKKYESMRLEMLQTLAVLPIPNKSMLQDSKVLSTVELWASDKDLTSPLDSDSNSPKTEQDTVSEACTVKEENIKTEDDLKTVQDQEEEIKFLANKLLEEWSNLKEVFKIPKKERIEQMKEHEREANKKFIQAQNAYENEQDKEKKSDRYRSFSVRYKMDKDPNRKGMKQGDKPSAEFLKLSKVERRKLFALQHELREEERRLKQREMWRQHETNCMMMGTDPRFTAPFDPSRGYHCVWNPQIGQWQNYPLPPNTSMYPSQSPLPNMSLPPHQIPKSMPSYSYTPPLPMSTNVGMGISQLTHGGLQLPSPAVMSQIPSNLPTAMPIVQYHEPIKEEDPSQVKFMGPIPPPVKLPPKWKCAKDKYGRPYYYHIKLRKSQWEPPPLVDPVLDENLDSSESESSSDTSSISSDSSSDNSESDVDDTKLLMEVRKQMDNSAKAKAKAPIPEQSNPEESCVATPSPEDKNSEDDMDLDENIAKSAPFNEDDTQRPSIDMRLKLLDLFKDDKPPSKKRRVGLCEEIIISPRTDEDKKQFKEDMKRYKANKEKLKRQKELILQQTKKQLREIELKKMKEKRSRPSLKTKIKDMPDFNSDAAKKIKETFRANMASTVVNSLNVYRKSDCIEGKITNTEDFKHLARKLTHFVMLKEMKHISKIEELTCTDSVKMKAREYIRKYMSKFGEVYVKRNDSPDFKD